MVAIFGRKFFCERLIFQLTKKNIHAVHVGESLRTIDFNQLQSHSTVHFIFSPTLSVLGILVLIRLKIMRKKIIVSWIGTDVFWVKTKLFRRLLSKIGNKLVDTNICVCYNLAKELKEMKIKSKVKPLPNFSIYKIQKLPSSNTVAVYLPDKFDYMWDFFSGNIIKRLVTEFPEVNFLILRNSGEKFSEKNVKCYEWIDDMEKLYSEVKIIIRLPLHDGLSNTILEALSMGRIMITTPVGIPYSKEASTYDEVKAHLAESLKNSQLNEVGSNHVHQNFNIEKITSDLIKIY